MGGGGEVSNGGFELGAVGVPPAPWAVQTFLNTTGFTPQTPQTYAGLNLVSGGKGATTIQNSPTGQQSQIDPDLGPTASLRWPRYQNQDAMVNFHSSSVYSLSQNANSLSQTFTLNTASIDPLDGQVHLRFVLAPVLQNPLHTETQQPYYFVQVTDLSQNRVVYSQFGVSGQPGVPWKSISTASPTEIDYTDWQLIDVPGNLTNGQLMFGDQLQVLVLASGCQPGGHFGEVYVDGVGMAPPGIFINGSAPATTSATQPLTYSMVYRNSSAITETGVTVNFTTPPNTTFQSIVPGAGLVCATPPVGASGTVSCTVVNPMSAGSAGTLAVKLAINPGTTGSIVFSNYSMSSTQETTILGNQLTTVLQ
ncbi:MAG TPA: hypothetical protein VNW54_03180 [Granulicella sp.]|nr:hypothetical protein [Granulicella sp.]